VIVQCCGADDIITEAELDDIQDACNTITQKYSNDEQIEAAYPLLERSTKHRNFGRNFAKFIHTFVQFSEAQALYDDCLVATLSSWLTAFSSSTVRAFRHTCTFTALKMGEQIVHVYNNLAQTEKDNERQLKAETAKKEKRKSGGAPTQKLKSLQTILDNLREQMDTLWDAIENVCSGVIVHRYRDISEQIRAIAVGALGDFVCNLPEKMLDDKYLKYVGWSLNEKNAVVRVAAANALVSIYEVEGAA